MAASNTPEKSFTYIDYTPTTKQLVCVLCGDKIDKREYRRKLYNSGDKSAYCILIEKHLDIHILEDLHTDILCRKCLREIQKIEAIVSKLQNLYRTTLENLKKTHGKQKSKRQLQTDATSSKRKALFPGEIVQTDNSDIVEIVNDDIVKVNVSHGSRNSDHILKKEHLSLLDSLFLDDINVFVTNCLLVEELKQAFENHLLTTIQAEVRLLCSKQTNSVLRHIDIESLKNLKWNMIMEEWEEKAPHFKRFLETITSNPSHQRNKTKKGEALVPGIASAGCKLLSVYNQEMNALQHVNSMVMLKGGGKKSAFSRLNSTNDTLSYRATLHATEKYGEAWSEELNAWSLQVKQDSNIVRHIDSN